MATAVTVTVDAVNYVFTPDSTNKDSVAFLENNSTLSLPKGMTLRRVYPKRQKGYPGNARNYLKTSRTILLADGITSTPIILETNVSRRADVSSTDFALARKIHAALISDIELDGFFSNLSL